MVATQPFCKRTALWACLIHHLCFATSQKRSAETLWKIFFSDTSQWWDHRPEKVVHSLQAVKKCMWVNWFGFGLLQLNPRFPDFKHKVTGESLWLVNGQTPSWVQAELDAVAPGTLQFHVFAWNQRLKRYVKGGQYLKTMEVFHQMQEERTCPDARTFVPVLNACAGLGALEEGKQVHTQIVQAGCESDVYVATCLVDMYAKCGSIEDAWSVFSKMREHNVVSWSAIIGGYVKSGQGLKALELFRKMQLEGVEPNAVTFVGVLNACAIVVDLQEGRRVHEQIIERGCRSDVYVANGLVDMYAKCGSIEDAWRVFNKMPKHDVVSWSAMIGGYVKSGQGLKAIEIFRRMQLEGAEPDAVIFIGVLNACASVAALQQGKHVHEQIIQRGYNSDIYVANCLVDMYAKCGSIEDAREVFDKIPKRDMISWTAMIGGYAMHGQTKKAIALFKQMSKEPVAINGITFTCLLSACSHGGLVKEGLRYFKSMTSCFVVRPTTGHHACMVDLLGRAGQLEEAEKMIKRMPLLERDACVWMSLLAACRVHGNIKMAERAASRCCELDSENASGHVLLSNIYAKWGRSGPIEERTLEGKMLKESVRTWIEVNNMVYSFKVDDKDHPRMLDIWAELERLLTQMDAAWAEG